MSEGALGSDQIAILPLAKKTLNNPKRMEYFTKTNTVSFNNIVQFCLGVSKNLAFILHLATYGDVGLNITIYCCGREMAGIRKIILAVSVLVKSNRVKSSTCFGLRQTGKWGLFSKKGTETLKILQKYLCFALLLMPGALLRGIKLS